MQPLRLQPHKKIVKMKRIFLLLVIFFLFSFTGTAFAHQPRLVYLKQGDINIYNPEVSQAFYDELKGQPRDYFISSDKDFNLYINLLVPEFVNPNGKYSVEIFSLKDGKELHVARFSEPADWLEFYEPFGRDYYLKGPEFDEQFLAGNYKVEVYSVDNQGKYVLAIGKQEVFPLPESLNIYWQLPLLKITFFKTSALQFFLTPFGIAGIGFIGALFILWAFINYLIAAIKQTIRRYQAKTILLTSAGMQVKDEIIKLLQKPAYDITVAFITTAAKPEEDVSFVKKDWDIMREMGFNIEEVDIEGKKESQLIKLLELKDIIFVEGGNTFYLLKAMRQCNFERVLRKLLKLGKVYIGASAGSIVAGKTIETAGWNNGDKNIVGLRNLKGLNLVPFDIFVHYQPEDAEIIKKNMRSARKRKKRLKILTDDQALLVQAKQVILIGKGEEVVV